MAAVGFHSKVSPQMNTVLAFDVYGTLIDTAGLVSLLEKLVGSEADAFSRQWREKQLEYSFRRGLMRQYETFATCTRDALEYTCASFDAGLSSQDKEALLSAYRTLPAFDDVPKSLDALHAQGVAMYAFSNGTADAVEGLLTTAGIRNYFVGVISVDELETFKPNPDVYHHFLRRSGASQGRTWLVSGNPFDVIGAISAGLRGAWVKRTASAIFDPWGIEPTIEVSSLLELGDRIAAHSH
jgi:2-haloacid dehalogenase